MSRKWPDKGLHVKEWKLFLTLKSNQLYRQSGILGFLALRGGDGAPDNVWIEIMKQMNPFLFYSVYGETHEVSQNKEVD